MSRKDSGEKSRPVCRADKINTFMSTVLLSACLNLLQT